MDILQEEEKEIRAGHHHVSTAVMNLRRLYCQGDAIRWKPTSRK